MLTLWSPPIPRYYTDTSKTNTHTHIFKCPTHNIPETIFKLLSVNKQTPTYSSDRMQMTELDVVSSRLNVSICVTQTMLARVNPTSIQYFLTPGRHLFVASKILEKPCGWTVAKSWIFICFWAWTIVPSTHALEKKNPQKGSPSWCVESPKEHREVVVWVRLVLWAQTEYFSCCIITCNSHSTPPPLKKTKQNKKNHKRKKQKPASVDVCYTTGSAYWNKYEKKKVTKLLQTIMKTTFSWKSLSPCQLQPVLRLKGGNQKKKEKVVSP